MHRLTTSSTTKWLAEPFLIFTGGYRHGTLPVGHELIHSYTNRRKWYKWNTCIHTYHVILHSMGTVNVKSLTTSHTTHVHSFGESECQEGNLNDLPIASMCRIIRDLLIQFFSAIEYKAIVEWDCTVG